MTTPEQIAKLNTTLDAKASFGRVREAFPAWAKAIAGGRSTADASGAPAQVGATDVLIAITHGVAPAADVDGWARAHAELLARDGFPVRASYLPRHLEDDASRMAAFALAASIPLLRGPLDAEQRDAFELLADSLDLDANAAESMLRELDRAMR
jgi:hypothetical protein